MKKKIKKINNKKVSPSLPSKVVGVKSIGEVITNGLKGKEKDKKPLERHKLLLKRISENIGKGEEPTIAIGKAMRDLNYSESYSLSPDKLKKTKSWNTLLETHLSDETLSQHHHELLNLKKIEYFSFSKKMSEEEIKDHVESAGLRLIVVRESEKGKLAFYSLPDGNAKKAALEMAYKLKAKFEPDKIDLKFNPYSKEQLVEMMLNKLKK